MPIAVSIERKGEGRGGTDYLRGNHLVSLQEQALLTDKTGWAVGQIGPCHDPLISTAKESIQVN